MIRKAFCQPLKAARGGRFSRLPSVPPQSPVPVEFHQWRGPAPTHFRLHSPPSARSDFSLLLRRRNLRRRTVLRRQVPFWDFLDGAGVPRLLHCRAIIPQSSHHGHHRCIAAWHPDMLGSYGPINFFRGWPSRYLADAGGRPSISTSRRRRRGPAWSAE